MSGRSAVVACLLGVQEVAGSIPVAPTNFLKENWSDLKTQKDSRTY